MPLGITMHYVHQLYFGGHLENQVSPLEIKSKILDIGFLSRFWCKLFSLSNFFFPILNIKLQYFPKCISQGTNTNLQYAPWKMSPIIQKLYEDCYILYSPSWSFCFIVLETITLGNVCVYKLLWLFVLACCCSVAQLCPTLCDPMDCSTPHFPVIHHLPELAQTHVYRVSDDIQPSRPAIPFSSCLQSLPASWSFLINQLLASGGQTIGASASASVLLMNIQDWFPLGLTGFISLQSKGLSRAFSDTTAQKQQFSIQPSLWSNSHIHTWLLEKP